MANPKTVKCVILRDFWQDDKDGKTIRHRAGEEIDVPFEAALDGVEAGSLARVKAAKERADD